MRTSRLVGAAVVSLLLLGGCGEEKSAPSATSDSSSSASPSASEKPAALPDFPACADVWKGDATLPHHYRGCLVGDKAVKAHGPYCEFGKKLITYEDHFYAVPGGTIHHTTTTLEKDPGYQRDMKSCNA